jgi:O-antigen/teichoic acid export membrane protein
MSLRKQAVTNVAATWMGLLVHAVTGFFLSPFILHKLGDQAFGIWVLVFAVTGYFGLLDFGIRSAIVKFTAEFSATNDAAGLSRYLSTSAVFYTLIGALTVIGTAILYFYLPFLFRIPSSLLGDSRLLLLLSGAGIAVTFPLTVFGAVLEGLQRFSWLQLSQIGVAILRAVLIVVALVSGGGLLAIGAITVAVGVLGHLVIASMAIYVLPVSFTAKQLEWKAFRRMATYGGFAFAIMLAEKLRFQSDAMVIGAMVSSVAITSFSVAARLVEYSSYAVRGMSQIFMPMSSELYASGDLGRLRRLFLAGNRASALVIVPACIALVVLGKPIIEAWVGARYLDSYFILVLLIVPRTLYLAQSTSIRILLGMGRHRVLASVLLLEGAINLLLSLLLARRFGIVGAALGTVIPLACTSLFFLPQHMCRVLEIPLITFLKAAYRLPLALGAFQVAVLVFVSREFPAHGYMGVLLEVAASGVVYFAYAGWALFNRGFSRTLSWHSFAHLLERE